MWRLSSVDAALDKCVVVGAVLVVLVARAASASFGRSGKWSGGLSLRRLARGVEEASLKIC